MATGTQPTSGTTGIGRGEPAVDLNGTRYTELEGRAADKKISIQWVNKSFDPLRHHGIALTTGQARALHVKVGQSVVVHDNWTSQDVEAVYYDNAGRPHDLHHFEVSPALADKLGLKYRNKHGKVIDAVAKSEHMKGRFDIRPKPKG